VENIFKKIAEGINDFEVHSEFIKFSKGTFENRYLIECKKQKKMFSLKTSAEFSNYLVRNCLKKINGEVSIKGIIISTFPLNLDFPVEKIKKYMGIQQSVINTNVQASKILEIVEKYPRVFFGLSFSGEDFTLKIKEKAPKSGKPSSKGEDAPRADFCYLKTKDYSIVEDLLFDCKHSDEVRISHTIKIEDIILPKDEKDPVQIRELARRKGKIIRKINFDNQEAVKEYKLDA